MVYNEYINSDATQLELKNIATSVENEFIRGSAIRKLLDQPTLEKLASSDPNPFIRSEATLRIKDQNRLATIVEKDPSPIVRRSAISSLKNIELLKQICLKDVDDHVRENAVRQLNYSCQDVLAIVAIEDPNWMVRHAAIWKMKADGENDEIFHQIGIADDNEEVRKAAMERLTDEELIHEIIMNDSTDKVKLSGILKITSNKQILADIALNCTTSKIRELAISKIDNQNLLKSIAIDYPDRWVREQAVNNIVANGDGLEVLTNIAMNDTDENVRYTAVKKIKNNQYLKIIIQESIYIDSVKVAVSNISDIEILAVLRLTGKLGIQNVLVERMQELLR